MLQIIFSKMWQEEEEGQGEFYEAMILSCSLKGVSGSLRPAACRASDLSEGSAERQILTGSFLCFNFQHLLN